MDDVSLIKRTLRLASKGIGRTSPNPAVGALLFRKGRIIAEGFHRKAGAPHAEAEAIALAGSGAKGATLYVSLEPCCHTGKRTPPCTDAIIAAGIRKVVISMEDPNPRVSGKGIRQLRAAGLEVLSGILEERARKLNEPYIKHVTTGLPFVTLKAAMTLDGKIATPEGESKWITGEKARKLVHRMRGNADAVLSAIGTVKADDPLLTCRTGGMKSPVRVIIDPELETPFDARITSIPPATLIVTRQPATVRSKKAMALLREKQVGFLEFSGERVDLSWLMRELGAMGMNSVLVEGGSSLNSSCLEAGIIDKVAFFIAPKIIGGRESFPVVGGRSFRSLGRAYRLGDATVRRVGEDFLIEGYIDHQA